VFEVNEQLRKHMKKVSHSLLQILKTNNSSPSLVLALYFPHFKSILSDLKADGYAN
jgi:hypothetical protein